MSTLSLEEMKAKPKHTPGPWTANETDPRGDWCIHARGIPWQKLAYVGKSSQIEWPLEANARLIAAAPELFDALSGLLADCDEYSRINNLHNEAGRPASNPAMEMARAALAKASQS